MSEKRRKFQINPGPLRIVPASKRELLKVDHNTFRCFATTRAGLRCIRDQLPDSEWCWQHDSRRRP